MTSYVGPLFLPLVLVLSILLQLHYRLTVANTVNGFDIQPAPLKIAAFNVQVFGNRKMAKEVVRNVLIKVIQRYDIILIQEIRSKTDDAITDLLRRVNNAVAPEKYLMKLSARLGRSVSKEQYAFFYRKDKVSVKDSYLYNDVAKGDKFEREPFIVRFHSPTSYVKDFAIGGIHVSPGDAVSEISNLVDVYDDITSRWGIDDVIFMGDFNAGCSYVRNKDWKQIRLATDRRFYWAFTDDQDTTVAKSDCPYDRMVLAGTNLVKSVVPGSAQVFRFDTVYSLVQEKSYLVSDHYPIEIQLKSSSYKDEELYIDKELELVNKDRRPSLISKTDMYRLRSSKNQLLKEGYLATSLYIKSGATNKIFLSRVTRSTNEAVSAVLTMQRNFPKLITLIQAGATIHSIQRYFGYQATDGSSTSEKGWVYQILPKPRNPLSNLAINMVKLICDIQNLKCWMSVFGRMKKPRMLEVR